jgi:hypothetical protein
MAIDDPPGAAPIIGLWLRAIALAFAVLAVIGSLDNVSESTAQLNFAFVGAALAATVFASAKGGRRAARHAERQSEVGGQPSPAPARRLIVFAAICLVAPLLPVANFGLDTVVRRPPIRMAVLGDTFALLLWTSWIAALGFIVALASSARPRLAAAATAFAAAILLLGGAEATIFLGLATLAPLGALAVINPHGMTRSDVGALATFLLPPLYWVVCALACATAASAMRRVRAIRAR